MKYIRKIATLIIVFAFLAAIAVGVGIIFAVKNVNVTLLSYSCAEDGDEAKDKIEEYKNLISGKVRGTIIAFVNEDDVFDLVDGSSYNVVSVEKVFPCTINVTLCERREVYTLRRGETYSVYDGEGKLLRNSIDESGSLNPIDGAPNVLITGVFSEEEVEFVASVGAIFEENFAPLRSTVESISYEPAPVQYAKSRIVFRLRCGMSVEVQECESGAQEKILKAYEVFASRSGEEKLKGRIYCFGQGENVGATYDPDGDR